jgi:hypothetical protein
MVIAASVAGCGGSGAGPLAEPKGAGISITGIPVKTHEFALTAIPFRLHLAHPLVLLGVRLIHPEDGHRLSIRYAAKTIRDAAIGGASGWRPTARGLHPLAGYVVQSEVPTEIVIGAAATKPGVYLLRGFIVDYRIGGTHYHAPQQIELRVCAARSCSLAQPGDKAPGLGHVPE